MQQHTFQLTTQHCCIASCSNLLFVLLHLNAFNSIFEIEQGLANSKKEDKKTEKQYHATVTEALNFNSVKDADTLHDAKGKETNNKSY